MKFKKSKGQVAKLLLALIIVIFVVIVIAYLVIKSTEKPVKLVAPEVITAPKAVYESTQNDIKITFQEATDYGNTLRAAASKNPKYQKDLKTTEKFIMVTIGAQNKGKLDTPPNVWDLSNIIDSDGRNFIADVYSINPWLPEPNGCGAILKPEFTPTSCSKIYEVAKGSTGLKVQVLVSKKDPKTDKYDSNKKDPILLDLIVNPQ